MSLGPVVWEQIRQGRPPDPELVDGLVEQHKAVLGDGGGRTLGRRVRSAVLGAGPLDEFIAGVGVTDVAVNGDGSVWVDRGLGMQRAPLTLAADEVHELALRLAGAAGRRLDESAAFVDGLLPSGVRLHAILPPLVPDGPHVTLRVPGRAPRSLGDLVEGGALPAPWKPVLVGLVRRRVSFLVSGGTGAGKTTLLAALLGLSLGTDRVVVVEDVRELVVDHAHVVHLEGRPANVEGVGAVTLTTLVRQALRMRPDRLVVGEVRGPEVRELLNALNTGHQGGCGTVHANSATDVVARVEALGALAGLSREAVQAQLASAVEALVHLRRVGATRRVESVAVLDVGSDRIPRVVEALGRDENGAPTTGPGWPSLARRCGVPE